MGLAETLRKCVERVKPFAESSAAERKQAALLFAAYVLFLLWVYFNYSFPYEVSLHSSIEQSAWAGYYSAQLFDSAVLLVCAMLCRRVERIVFSMGYCILMVFFCSVGLLFASVPLPGQDSIIVYLLLNGLPKGVGTALITLQVGALFALSDNPNRPLLALAALFTAIILAISLFALPSPALLLVILVVPLLLTAVVSFSSSASSENASKNASRPKLRKLVPLGVKLAIMVCVFNSANNISKGIYRYSNETVDPFAMVLTIVLMLAVLVASCATYGKFSTVSLYRTLFLFTLVCFLVTPAIGNNPSVANSMVAVTATMFRTFLFICEFQLSAKTGLSPILVFGVGETLKRVPNFLMMAIVPEFSIESVMQDQFVYLAYFLLPGLLLVFVYVLVCTESDFRFFERQERLESAQELVEQYRTELARSYGLSDRETEVFLLLAKGKSGPKIAEELFLATGTINVYVKKIYKKLGVHTRQELIELASYEPGFVAAKHSDS